MVEKNYESIILNTLSKDNSKRRIFFALFNSKKKLALDSDQILSYVGGIPANLTMIYPAIEEMADEGLVNRNGFKKVEGGGKNRVYSLDDKFYNACVKFNKNNNNLIERFADICSQLSELGDRINARGASLENPQDNKISLKGQNGKTYEFNKK
ncbi:MAG: hypothetical protein JSW73_00370 [Candidatus Woesearchaeota archaeon]|nr:MAG: hypothetical protein JSW73_00370 [Candidatus Woesearchaeota archaeon]